MGDVVLFVVTRSLYYYSQNAHDMLVVHTVYTCHTEYYLVSHIRIRGLLSFNAQNVMKKTG